jgi:hypothetical protein
VISGSGHGLAGMAQLNVQELGAGVTALITDPAAREALWRQVTTTVGQAFAGDGFVAGQLIGELASIVIPGAAAGKVARASGLLKGAAEIGGAGAAKIAALNGIPGVSVVGDKVLVNGVAKMSVPDWDSIYASSIHNGTAPESMLGKYVGGGDESYVIQAENGGYRYFSLGTNWERIEAQYGLDDVQMFELFNKPFLDEAIRQRQTVRFTHDPEAWGGALKQELDYLTNARNGFRYDPETMTASPRKGS